MTTFLRYTMHRPHVYRKPSRLFVTYWDQEAGPWIDNVINKMVPFWEHGSAKVVTSALSWFYGIRRGLNINAW